MALSISAAPTAWGVGTPGTGPRDAAPQRTWTWAWAVAGALALAGCGGGGGGGAESMPPPPVGSSSMIPAAPTPGAVLFADAATLRPLTPGAVWRYRGTASGVPGQTTTTYSTDTSITSAAGGALTESGTNAANDGAASHPITLEGGSIVVTEQFDFTGKGPGETVKLTQLRSPVRADDQWTILERRFTDTAVDADQDGKPDALDVAIYARVIGTETLTLPRLAPLQAVRVDTRVLVRAVLSSTGKLSDVQTLEIQDWYAPGIGLVQERTREPVGVGTQEMLETLVGYDLGDFGDGLAFSRIAQVPASSPAMGGSALPDAALILGAREFDGSVLLLQRTSSFLSESDLLASTIDRRGQVVRTLRHAFSPATYVPPMFHANGAVLAGPPANGLQFQVQLTSLSATGELSATRPVIDLAATSTRPAAFLRSAPLAGATDGRTVWLTWLRTAPGITMANELVLRGFDLSGAPATPEAVITTENSSGLQVLLSGGKLLVTWAEGTPGSYAQKLAVLDPSTLGGSSGTIATGLANAVETYQPERLFFSQPSGSTLVWVRPLVAGAALPGVGMLRFSDSFQPLAGGTGAIDTELAPGLSVTSGMNQLVGRGQRLYHLEPTWKPMWLDQTSLPTTQLKLSWLESGSVPMTQAPVRSLEVLPDRQDSMQLLVPLSDRVLGFNGSPNLRTTVIWLPKDARQQP
ncbi:hypothetical protein ACQ86G_18090 [Roseateles chitinivorans]|uniref:hypothetical protein n=1 Tax=Roseateles chitinivorans TaxID=2917965 RepID=UPI003D66B968